MNTNRNLIVIVGGSGGIGSVVSRLYAIRGHQVCVLDIQEPQSPAGDYYQVDITDTQNIQDVAERIRNKYGAVSHLINVTGGVVSFNSESGSRERGEFEGLFSMPPDIIEKSIFYNLVSPIHLVKTFLPYFSEAKDDNPSAVLISSINALRDYGCPAYSAAKAGLYGFVKSVSAELGQRGVRINTVSPGTVKTPRTMSHPKDWTYLEKNTALGRLATREDVAQTVYALTHFMTGTTGQDVVVDAGQTIVAGLKP